MLFYLFAKEACTKQGEYWALVWKGGISNDGFRLRQLPAAPFVVHRRYLIVAPMPSLELELIQPQMVHKLMLRAEVYARALGAS